MNKAVRSPPSWNKLTKGGQVINVATFHIYAEGMSAAAVKWFLGFLAPSSYSSLFQCCQGFPNYFSECTAIKGKTSLVK